MSGTDGTRDSRDKAAQCPTINKDGPVLAYVSRETQKKSTGYGMG